MIAIEKNVRKVTWNNKLLNNKSKDKDSNFLVIFPLERPQELLIKGKGSQPMLVTIYDDTWNVLNMQHITSNSKRWDYSDTPGGGHKKIKGPTHMVEGGHHLR